MDMVVSPISRIRPGATMPLPVVIALRAPPPTRRDPGDSPYEFGDVSGIWAFVSLVTEDKNQTLAPPRGDLLLGRTVDSVHPALDEHDPEDRTVGYALFPGLAIAESGTYRLKVTLIDMDSNGSMFGEPMQSGRNLKVVHSGTVHVVTDAQESEPDSGDVEIVTRLRAQGLL